MFANRFTVVVDACSLFSPLTRNLLLSLAEGEFFRLRWSARILEEVERAIARSYAQKAALDGTERAARARAAMERAFEEAAVTGYDALMPELGELPDPTDAHVIAAAVKTRASVIVTETSGTSRSGSSSRLISRLRVPTSSSPTPSISTPAGPFRSFGV